VVGQNFEARSHGVGKAAYSLEYGFVHALCNGCNKKHDQIYQQL